MCSSSHRRPIISLGLHRAPTVLCADKSQCVLDGVLQCVSFDATSDPSRDTYAVISPATHDDDLTNDTSCVCTAVPPDVSFTPQGGPLRSCKCTRGGNKGETAVRSTSIAVPGEQQRQSHCQRSLRTRRGGLAFHRHGHHQPSSLIHPSVYTHTHTHTHTLTRTHTLTSGHIFAMSARFLLCPL